MDRVELIINAGKISSRIKFFLQDVIELRNVLLYVCLSVHPYCHMDAQSMSNRRSRPAQLYHCVYLLCVVCMCICMFVHVCMCIFVCIMCVCLHLCVCIYVYCVLYVCMCDYVYVCMCTYLCNAEY